MGKITEAQQEDMRKRYLAGESISDLARLYEVDTSAIHWHLRKMGIWRKKQYIDRGCSVPGCSKPHDAQGYCHTHYEQFRRRGYLGSVSKRPYMKRSKNDCDHKTNKCDCINLGKNYGKYLEKARLSRNNKGWNFNKILTKSGPRSGPRSGHERRGKMSYLMQREEERDKRDRHEGDQTYANEPRDESEAAF